MESIVSFNLADGPGRRDCTRPAGFTLLELMVGITILLLGVISAGGVLVTVEHAANYTETRYRDYADLRVRAESLKAQVSTGALSGDKAALFPAQFKTGTGHDGQTHYEVGAAGLPNLVWVQMTVEQEGGGDPLVFNTYLRAGE